ncbi:hypothetical protein HID58_076591 [Brassica napus]|uniref:Uncharacterized protein n=1 Tax=Brassica napus TaxID=3708 RepID=A0ABQ7YMX7_BRANA|nr:hypothetical protein HID58_076591 [Brassica napus]
MEDAIAAASATVEAAAANRSSGGYDGYGGGGYGDEKRGLGGGTVEVAVDTGVEVVVVMDTKVVVDTFGNFVDETSLTNLIHTISSMELC